MMKHTGFPRFSFTGALILAAYLYATMAAFDAIHVYSHSLRSGKFATSSSITLNGVIMATSLLNSVSHGAVVLGALHDTYVISILVGVGFDIMTRMIYVVWWVQLSAIAFWEHYAMDEENERTNKEHYAATILFQITLSAIYIYHMVVHMKALRMDKPYDRLIKEFRSALNNLRGIVGENYEDHIFAYSDLGSHLAPLWLSSYLLKQQQALLYGFFILVLCTGVSTLILSGIPFNNANFNPFVRLQKEYIVCSCPACKRRFQTTGEHSSFTFTRREGVCCLWLYSFEDLSNILLRMSETELSKKR